MRRATASGSSPSRPADGGSRVEVGPAEAARPSSEHLDHHGVAPEPEFPAVFDGDDGKPVGRGEHLVEDSDHRELDAAQRQRGTDVEPARRREVRPEHGDPAVARAEVATPRQRHRRIVSVRRRDRDVDPEHELLGEGEELGNARVEGQHDLGLNALDPGDLPDLRDLGAREESAPGEAGAHADSGPGDRDLTGDEAVAALDEARDALGHGAERDQAGHTDGDADDGEEVAAREEAAHHARAGPGRKRATGFMAPRPPSPARGDRARGETRPRPRHWQGRVAGETSSAKGRGHPLLGIEPGDQRRQGIDAEAAERPVNQGQRQQRRRGRYPGGQEAEPAGVRVVPPGAGRLRHAAQHEHPDRGGEIRGIPAVGRHRSGRARGGERGGARRGTAPGRRERGPSPRAPASARPARRCSAHRDPIRHRAEPAAAAGHRPGLDGDVAQRRSRARPRAGAPRSPARSRLAWVRGRGGAPPGRRGTRTACRGARPPSAH